ncbi:MAG: hypothetical protein ACK6DQ_09870 [Planctomycetota bacterium]
MRGRLPIRVRDGHIYVFEPSVRDFHSAPIGNPNRVAAADNGLGPTLVRAFKTLREEIEATYEDVVYEIDLDADPTMVRITVFEPAGSRTLKPRRFSPNCCSKHRKQAPNRSLLDVPNIGVGLALSWLATVRIRWGLFLLASHRKSGGSRERSGRKSKLT